MELADQSIYGVCPIFDFEVEGGLVVLKNKSLSVGAVDLSTLDERISRLNDIRNKVLEICKHCKHHYSKTGGTCDPGSYFATNGFVSSVIVRQNTEIPAKVKYNSSYYYKDHDMNVDRWQR